MLLFLKMRQGHKFTPELDRKIRDAIRTALSTRHVPAHIFEVEEIPVSLFPFYRVQTGKEYILTFVNQYKYTVNGKKIEIAVKQIVSGSNLQPSGTVANPDSLKLYYKFRDIEKVVNTMKSRL